MFVSCVVKNIKVFVSHLICLGRSATNENEVNEMVIGAVHETVELDKCVQIK